MTAIFQFWTLVPFGEIKLDRSVSVFSLEVQALKSV
jgi:hypothetical protein